MPRILPKCSIWFRLAAHVLGAVGAFTGAAIARSLDYSDYRALSIGLCAYFGSYGIAYFAAEIVSMIWPRKS